MNNPRTAWLVYTVLRLLFFAVPFAVLYLLQITPWIAAIFAALIGVSLSVLLLSRPRATASESIYDWRNRDRTADDIAEDDAIAAADDAAAGTEAIGAIDSEASATSELPDSSERNTHERNTGE